MLKKLSRLKNTEENKVQVCLVRSGLRDLKEEIKETGEDEKETGKPNEIMNVAENGLEFNTQNQERQGLKILTPDQMLSGFLWHN